MTHSTQDQRNHPDLPEQGEDEDFLEHLNRVALWLTGTPPAAPQGFRLIECERDSRHHPLYEVAEDVFYPRPCPDCVGEDAHKRERELICKRDHRRWKSWRGLRWMASKGYSLGIIAGCGSSYGRCEFCGVGVQHDHVRWTGRRPYVLGVSADSWRCMLRYRHRRTESVYSRGICTNCLPCPECESTDPEHYSCEVGA